MRALGKNINRLMRAKGFSSYRALSLKVSERLKINPDAKMIWRITREDSNPTLRVLMAIADELECTINDLVYEPVQLAHDNKAPIDKGLFLKLSAMIDEVSKEYGINLSEKQRLDRLSELYLFCDQRKIEELPKEAVLMRIES